MAVDPSDNAYITSQYSLTKLNLRHLRVLFRIYLPFRPVAIGRAASGNLFVVGSDAEGADSQMPGPLFVAGVTPTGTVLFSTKITEVSAAPAAIAVAPDGRFAVVGTTWGGPLPGLRALPRHGNISPALGFVTVFGTAGRVLSSRYLGTSGSQQAMAAAFDAAGHLEVAGWTSSPKFPLRDALPHSSCSGGHAFVTELAIPDDHTLRSTCIDQLDDVAFNSTVALAVSADSSYIAADHTVVGVSHHDNTAQILSTTDDFSHITSLAAESGILYVAGSTSGSGTCGIEEASHPCTQAFIRAFTSSGTTVLSENFGGSQDNVADGVGVVSQQVCATGATSSTDFPLVRPVQKHNQGDVPVNALGRQAGFIACFLRKTN